MITTVTPAFEEPAQWLSAPFALSSLAGGIAIAACVLAAAWFARELSIRGRRESPGALARATRRLARDLGLGRDDLALIESLASRMQGGEAPAAASLLIGRGAFDAALRHATAAERPRLIAIRRRVFGPE